MSERRLRAGRLAPVMRSMGFNSLGGPLPGKLLGCWQSAAGAPRICVLLGSASPAVGDIGASTAVQAVSARVSQSPWGPAGRGAARSPGKPAARLVAEDAPESLSSQPPRSCPSGCPLPAPAVSADADSPMTAPATLLVLLHVMLLPSLGAGEDSRSPSAAANPSVSALAAAACFCCLLLPGLLLFTCNSINHICMRHATYSAVLIGVPMQSLL